jgi:hypothetical protein
MDRSTGLLRMEPFAEQIERLALASSLPLQFTGLFLIHRQFHFVSQVIHIVHVADPKIGKG